MNSRARKLIYPNREIVEDWISFVKEKSKILRKNLPATDEVWYKHVIDAISRCEYSYYPEEVHTRAAELFYNIIKSHGLTDGNKRTGIVITYLFYVCNGLYITKHVDMRTLAKKVARSHGRERHDEWIEKIKITFESCTETLFDGEVE